MTLLSHNTQKGAMFGLDARIALAIFGSLALITGSVLHSVLEDLKYNSQINRFKEMEQGVLQYLADTRKDFPARSANLTGNERMTLELLESVRRGWKGPYLDYDKTGSDHTIQDSRDPVFGWHLTLFTNNDWGDNTNSGGELCTATSSCYYWLKTHLGAGIAASKKEEFAMELDKYFDNGDGFDKGRYRVNWYSGDRSNPILFYRVTPLLSTRF